MAPHGGFIVAAYALTALVVAALVLRAMRESRQQRRLLADLEARGAGRRIGRG